MKSPVYVYRRCLFSIVSLLLVSHPAASRDFYSIDSFYSTDIENDTEDSKAKDFTMDGELGLLFNSGNTRASTLNVKINAEHDVGNWNNRYVVEGLYTKSQRVDLNEPRQTTAQRVNASVQADYKLVDKNERIFAFGDFEDNRFNGFDYQASVAAGWTRVKWENEISSFRYSIGPGYNVSKAEDGSDDKNNGIIIRASADYSYRWNSGALFRQSISTIAGQANTRSRAETSLSANIMDSLGMKLSLRLDHNSSPPADNVSLNTETSISLVYQFF